MPAGWDPLRFDCPDAIAGHGRPDPAAIYGAPGVFTTPHADVDLYGAGTRLNAFEARIAALLGKDAAVFMPSGTMAKRNAAIARDTGIYAMLRPAQPTAIDGIMKWELTTGDATLALGPDRARAALETLLAK
jgi:hypothetical protein